MKGAKKVLRHIGKQSTKNQIILAGENCYEHAQNAIQVI
jgi:hypothetical protein